jgi:hypothetical protein
MLRIPLQAVPNQTLAVTLARQPVQLAVRQNGGSLYIDVMHNGLYIVRTRICRNRQRLLLDAGYRGFAGDFMFVDTQGSDDPQYAGLGVRYQLLYIGADE